MEFSAGSLAFGAVTQHGLEGFFQLGFDINIFKDGEIRPVLVGVEPAIFAGDDDDGDFGRLRLGLECRNEFGASSFAAFACR